MLSILTASSPTVVYPKVVLTVVFISTVVYILTVVSSLSDYSPQHSPHSYFHVILISAYPAVRVKLYAYVNMLGRNDLIICWRGKQSLQAYNYVKGRNQRRNKDLNRHLECTDVNFNPENGAFSKITQIDRQTHRQSDYCSPLAHVH